MHKNAPSINVAVIFYLSPWMSANNREREHEGKGERVLEKGESGLGGVIKHGTINRRE